VFEDDRRLFALSSKINWSPPEGSYAITSHSSQGQTADRVLIHADTELGARDLLNNRMAYVAASRSAHAPEMKPEQKQEQAVTPQREIAPEQEQSVDIGLGL
jgi:hypothetical protein